MYGDIKINQKKVFSMERKKIILVDDNPVNLKIARNALMTKYDVFTVPSAKKLFQFLEQILPDLILLDVLMPGISGYKAIEELKKERRTADIPIIFLTSKADTRSELEGLNLGAVDYIVKPFSPQLLLKRVDLHLLVESQKKELKNLNDNLIHMVDQKTEEIFKLQHAILQTVSNLVECRDDVTGEHIEHTEKFLRILVERMFINDVYNDILRTWDINLFVHSAQLHDVGKISIRDKILLKPGKLNADEFEEMKKHTIFGEIIIERIQKSTKENIFLTHAKIMAGTHHERWDGSGYPRGIAGDKIPLQGRLMAIVDVYDALTSKRPYKEAFSHEEAVEIIREEKGSHFDPVLTDVFLAAFASRV
jgi:putative two-component system response regulator